MPIEHHDEITLSHYDSQSHEQWDVTAKFENNGDNIEIAVFVVPWVEIIVDTTIIEAKERLRVSVQEDEEIQSMGDLIHFFSVHAHTIGFTLLAELQNIDPEELEDIIRPRTL